ncbi:hypothetical protein M513_12347, partial [Trichuris suis]
RRDLFLAKDAVVSEDRILLFTTRTNVDKLAHAPVWIMDGTFKTAPMVFYQIYTIHAPVGSRIFPLVYALMSGKSQALYKRLFEDLVDVAEEYELRLNPQVIMTGLQLAAINATKSEFQDVVNKAISTVANLENVVNTATNSVANRFAGIFESFLSRLSTDLEEFKVSHASRPRKAADFPQHAFSCNDLGNAASKAEELEARHRYVHRQLTLSPPSCSSCHRQSLSNRLTVTHANGINLLVASRLCPRLRASISSSLQGPKLYGHALADLRRLFGDPNLVIDAYIRTLMDMSPVKPGNANDVNRFFYEIHGTVTTLRAYEATSELSSRTTLQTVVSKLDRRMQYAWAKRQYDLRPRTATLCDFDEWLAEIVAVHNNVQANSKEPQEHQTRPVKQKTTRRPQLNILAANKLTEEC